MDQLCQTPLRHLTFTFQAEADPMKHFNLELRWIFVIKMQRNSMLKIFHRIGLALQFSY